MRLLRTQRQGIPAAAHHIGFAVRLTRPVTPDRLTQILTGLAARHAALRTAIVADAGHGQQLEIRREPAGPLLRWSPVAGHVDAGRRLRELMEPPFDLDTAPLWRFELLEPESGEQILLYGAHHAVCDAQSLALVMAELGAELSGARLSNVASNRDIDRLPEAQPAAGADPLAAQWREEFAGCRRLDLALARARPATRTFRAGTLFADMPGGLLEQVMAQASQLAITPAAFCLGTLTVLLARLRGHRRFVLAVPVDTRMHAGALDALGFFGIPIPFPAEVAAEEPIADVLRRTDTRMNRVLEKGASFFDAMPALIDEGLYRADAPLVEVYFNFIRPHTLTAPGLEVVQAGTGYSDLDLMVTVASDLNHVRLDYNLDIIDEPSCGRFAHDYLRLLAEVAGGPALQTTARPAPAPPSGSSIALAATFALGNMPALLRGALQDDGPGGSDRPELTVDEAPYHQVLASLQDPAGVFARPSTVAGVVLLRARDLERFGPVSDDLLTDLADEYPAAVRSLSQRTGVPLIVGFAPAHPADARLGEWEQHLAARLAEQPGVAVVRHDEWGRQYPVSSRFDEDTDALAHLPFQPEFQAAMALTVADVLRAVLRPPPKVIAVDGDETLWGGIAGEIGPDQVELAGPRAVLARRLLDWRAAGVLLVLVSNNDEATVRAVLDRPESLLRADSFSVISLGWQPKGERLADAARDLGLGLDSFLFLDDNPAEIAAVRSVLPEVLSVTCPAAGELDGFLARLWPIIPRAATAEDSRRAEFYRQEQARRREHTQAGFAGFLRRLQLEVDISPLSAATMKRSVQLSRRTSQFNLRPAALDEAALTAWQDDGEVWTASARDRFGDYGQVGLLVIRQDGDTLEVVAWMLSCRALGRGVEERLLAWLADRADALRCPAVRLIAEHTPRNVPARRIVAALGGTDIDSPVLDVVTQPSCLRAFRSWATGSGEDMRAHHG